MLQSALKIFTLALVMLHNLGFAQPQHTLLGDSLLEEAMDLSPGAGFNYLMRQVDSLKTLDLPTTHQLSYAAYQVALSHAWEERQLEALNELSSASYLMGNYKQSMEWEEIRMNTYIQKGDSLGLARHLTFMANGLRKVSAHTRGLALLERARRIQLAAQDSLNLSIYYDHKGLIFSDLAQFEAAGKAWDTCLNIRLAIQDTVGLGFIYDRLSQYMTFKQDYQAAVQYQQQSMGIRQRLNDQVNLTYNLSNLGQIYYIMYKEEQALPLLQAATEQAHKLYLPELEKHASYQTALVAKAIGKYDIALEYMERSLTLRDSLLDAQRLRNIQELQAQFDTERKQRTIMEEQSQNQRLRIILFSVVLSLGLVGIIGFLMVRNKQQARIKQQALAYQQNLLASTIEATEAERSRISRDLHDGIGQQLVGLQMGLQQLTPKAHSKQLEKITSVLKHITQEVRGLSHQLMPKALEGASLPLAMEEVIQQTLGEAGIPYDFGALTQQSTVPPKIKLGLFRILQELCANIIKHAQATQVDILLHHTSSQWILTVEDNGVGMDQTHGHKGIGLQNISSRVQILNGELHWESVSPQGTRTTIRIPNAKVNQHD